MLIEVTYDVFQKLNLKPTTEILATLKKEYPTEYNDAINHLQDTLDYLYDGGDVFDMCTLDEIIDAIDDNIIDAVLINFVVMDSVATDWGVHKEISESGYKIKECEKIES